MSRHANGAAARAEDAAAQPAITPDTAEDLDAAPPAGLEALYRQHGAWLVEALRRRFGRDAAEDLSQEAFTRVRPYADRAIPRPRALLMTIASNAAREWRRRAAVRSPDALEPSPSSAEALTPASGPAQFDTLLLKQVIMGLPPKLRVVFVLNRFEGLTYSEIAQRLGVSTKTVEWRMSKALDHCAARLRD